MNKTLEESVTQRAQILFEDHQTAICRRTDRLFARLMLCQWIAAIAAAFWLTPRTWAGRYSQVHFHIWAAIFFGGAITLLPVILVHFQPGEFFTREVIAASQMLMSALLIHLTGGRIETHFHVFGSLAFLVFYRDWRVFVPATLVVAADHYIRGVYWPQSVFGVLAVSPWRWTEHAAWVLFEDAFLIRSCLQSVSEMRNTAHQRAELEATNEIVEGKVIDRTAKLQASERALQDSEHRYRMLFEDSPLPMVVFDAETLAFLAVNAAAEELYGYRHAEFLSMTLADTRAPEDVPALLEFMKDIEDKDTYRASFRIRRKDGTLIVIETRGQTIDFGDRRARLSLLTDITDRKRLESQLQQSQKMEAVGRLAGGIAHDFNNLLTVILGYSDSIRRKLSQNHPLHEQVSEIHAAGERAANLTSQLLAFSRKQILQPQTLELNRVITNIAQMLRRLLGEDVELALCLDSNIGMIQADVTQFEQVLVNLAVNARDAMPSGGQLVIETHNCELDDDTAVLQGLMPGHYVVLAVSDTGCGMDETTKEKIFEPFFTTKELGKGTGLGLSMVVGFVQQSGGAVTVYSEVQVGTTFRIYLPRLDAPSPTAIAKSDPETIAGGNGATILLVEDEDRVRTLAREILSEAGYVVVEASNANKAWELAKNCTKRPALVLTDVVMPGMSGLELAEQLQSRWPGLPVICTSGYTDHALLTRTTPGPNTTFLQKPYSRESLLRQIAVSLEHAGRPSVLIVDDDKTVRKLLRTTLEEAGYAVIEARDGQDALKQISGQCRIELVVTDLVMPERDGMETIQTLKRSYPDVKILAISGAFGGGFLKVASKIGADATLPKPFLREQVVQTVNQLLC